MADAVDRPGDVLQQQHPDQPSPDQSGKRAGPGPRQQPAEQGRAEQTDADPQREQGVNPDNNAVSEQVRGVPGVVGALGVEEPTDLSPAQALGQGPRGQATPGTMSSREAKARGCHSIQTRPGRPSAGCPRGTPPTHLAL